MILSTRQSKRINKENSDNLSNQNDITLSSLNSDNDNTEITSPNEGEKPELKTTANERPKRKLGANRKETIKEVDENLSKQNKNKSDEFKFTLLEENNEKNVDSKTNDIEPLLNNIAKPRKQSKKNDLSLNSINSANNKDKVNQV